MACISPAPPLWLCALPLGLALFYGFLASLDAPQHLEDA
jgi:hypothetical protein